MKISESTITEIKDKLKDVLCTYVHFGTGRRSYANCPLPTHLERTPSFSYDKDRNIWKCFGCGAGGDTIKFIQLMHPEKTFTEVIQTAAEILDIKVEYGENGSYSPSAKKDPQEVPFESLDNSILSEKVNACKTLQLTENPLLRTMCDQFDGGTVRTIIDRYAVSFQREWIEFPEVDLQLKYRTGKSLKYLSNGHRCKETNPRWAHTGITDKFRQCLTGMHLLKYFPEKQVAVVEGASTMLFMACLSLYAEKNNIKQLKVFTEFIWLSTGGVGGVSFKDTYLITSLAGRKVVLYPDSGAYTTWKKEADYMINSGVNVFVSTLMEKAYESGKVNKNIDLRDYFSKNITSIQKLATAQMNPPIATPSVPSMSLGDILQVNSEVHTGKDFNNVIIAWVKTKQGEFDILFNSYGELLNPKEDTTLMEKIEKFYDKKFIPILFDNTPGWGMQCVYLN